MEVQVNYNNQSQQNKYLQQNVNQILQEASKPVNNLKTEENIQEDKNPYKDFVDDKTWRVFLEASNGFDERAVDDVKKVLFENKNFSHSTAMSLLDWATRADVVSNNISIPEINSTDITEFKKSIIANQLQQIVQAKKTILENFSLMAKEGATTPLDMVA